MYSSHEIVEMEALKGLAQFANIYPNEMHLMTHEISPIF